MAALTLTQLITLRDATYEAYQKAVLAASYAIGTRALTRAQPEQLYRQLMRLEELIRIQQGAEPHQAYFPEDY